MRQEILDGGPLALLLHLLFVANVILALVVVTRRYALPWMLLVSCGPFIWAASAAHVSFVYNLAVFDHTAPAATQLAPFVYAMKLFNWGGIVSVAFMGLAFFRRPNREKTIASNA
jgi:hypothetical protein